MPLNSIIPKNSHLSVIGGLFKAVLNVPTIGKYDFINYAPAGSRFNVAVDLGLAMNPNYLYYFHQMSFSFSFGEEIYLSAIDPGTVPALTIRDSSTSKNIFHAPFRMLKYFENAAVDSFHFNLNTNAHMIADFQAVLVQVPAIIGITDIFAQVSFMVYEISDPSFKEKYLREKKG
jgi:hypothetical protein